MSDLRDAAIRAVEDLEEAGAWAGSPERVVDAVLGIVAARLAAVEALADEWEERAWEADGVGQLERVAELRAAVRAEPSEAARCP
jgi:hypothetical protein